MKTIAVSAWPPRNSGVISASPMKPPSGSHLVFDQCRHLGRLHAAKARERKAQDVVEQLIAQAPEHALAHPALHRVDLELEPAVQDDEREKQDRQCKQI